MSNLFDNDQPADDVSVSAELEQAVRARGVRVEQRLTLLSELEEQGGDEAIEARIDALEDRIRQASRKVAAALRGSGR